MRSTFEVTDLFKSAFFLCMGARLDKVRVRNSGRRIATFLITGKDLERLDRDYRAGRALVNPVQLRESLNHLRDVMFDRLRKHDPAPRECYAKTSPAPHKRYAGQEGRKRDDHSQRSDRKGQGH